MRMIQMIATVFWGGASVLANGSAPAAAAAPEDFRLFSGEPRLFVVHGYSTSFHWWGFLQHKIDRYFDGRRVIEVRPATSGGTPIAKWMDVNTGQPQRVWEEVLRPALKAKADRPAIVLAQQSLQWTFGPRGAGIRDPQDQAKIKQGADVLQQYAERLLADGADEVFIATHIYKRSMEPQIGNERLALAELIKRKVAHVHAGPDVWEPLRQQYPKAFARDRQHPNSIGAEIMAQTWFETLLAHDGLEAPAWSREETADALKGEAVDLRDGAFERLLEKWNIRYAPQPRPAAAPTENEEPLDRQKARQLRMKQRQGQALTDEEKAYLERAWEEYMKNRRGGPGVDGRQPHGGESTGLVPLTELIEQSYKEQTGGLYGNGKNVPPPSHQEAAETELGRIQPLNADGSLSATGKIVLLSVGMSNTTQEFSRFKAIADADTAKSPHVVIVDCAQGGMAAHDWAHPEQRRRKDKRSPWPVMDERFENAGVTAAQVQAVWIKQAQAMPERLGEFPKHAQSLRDDVTVVLSKLKAKFPNLRVAYLSSRIYAGYANNPLNPEPYAYESAFAVRWLIEDQIRGEPELNFDPARGEVKSPLLLWGPYLWADGVRPGKDDGLVWKREDFARDGTHPSESGRQKVAEMLLKFFKSDPNARTWFLKSGS